MNITKIEDPKRRHEPELDCLQGFKVTKQSLWRSTLCWQATSTKKHPYMSNQHGLGFQLAQLGRDASAAVSNSNYRCLIFPCTLFFDFSSFVVVCVIFILLMIPLVL